MRDDKTSAVFTGAAPSAEQEAPAAAAAGPSSSQPPPSSDAGLPRAAPEVSPLWRKLIIALVIVITVSGLAGTALSPYLLVEHPLVLVGLNCDSRHLVLAAAQTDLSMIALVAVPRRIINFIGTYALAWLYGHVAVRWLEGRRPWVKRLIRFAGRAYQRYDVWLVALIPLYSIAGLAGIGRLRLRTFVLAIIPGQIAFVLTVLVFGDAVTAWTQPLIAFLSQHLVESTAACVLLVLVQQLYRRYQRRRNRPQGEPEWPL